MRRSSLALRLAFGYLKNLRKILVRRRIYGRNAQFYRLVAHVKGRSPDGEYGRSDFDFQQLGVIDRRGFRPQPLVGAHHRDAEGILIQVVNRIRAFLELGGCGRKPRPSITPSC